MVSFRRNLDLKESLGIGEQREFQAGLYEMNAWTDRVGVDWRTGAARLELGKIYAASLLL